MPIEQFLLIPVFVVRFCVSLFVLRLKSLNSQYSCSDLKRKIICYQFELGNNLVTFRLMFQSSSFTLMTTGTFSQNVSKLFSQAQVGNR